MGRKRRVKFALYNQEQKERYCRYFQETYSESSLTNIKTIFGKTAEVETLFGKDVSEFSREDISNMYSLFRYVDEFIYSTMNSRLSKYTDWCIEQNLVHDGCNHFKEFTYSDYSKYINTRLEKRKYLSPDEFERFCDDIPNFRDEFVVRCIYEFGKNEEFTEIREMRLGDIDFEGLTICLCTGRVVKVSRKLVEVAKLADEQTAHIAKSKGPKPYVPSPMIFKRVVGYGSDGGDSPNSGNKLMARVVKDCVSVTGAYSGINTTSISVSGQIAMIKRRSKELGISTVDYVWQYYATELALQYNLANDSRAKYRYHKKYGIYIDD